MVRKVPRRFPRRKFYAAKVDAIWSIDLMDFSKRYVRVNNGFRYALIAIDVFSRYAFARPMKQKTATVTRDALLHIFTTSGREPQMINCDRGTEFYNRPVRQLLTARNITMYSTHNDVKGALCERLIRTLRRKIEKHYILSHSTVWHTALDDIISSYNSDVHRILHMAPSDAILARNHDAVYRSQFPTEKDKVPNQPRFLPGEQVRISIHKRLFDKESSSAWSEEVFEVEKTLPSLPPVYKLKDLQGESLTGLFYGQQLQKTEQKKFRIDRVIRRRNHNGIREVLVRWEGINPNSIPGFPPQTSKSARPPAGDSTLPDTFVWKEGGNEERENSFLLPKSIRGVVCGKSACGKTSLVTYLLLHPDLLDYEKLVICARSLHQPEYTVIRRAIDKKFSKNQIRTLFEMQREIQDEGGLDKVFDDYTGPSFGGISGEFHDSVFSLPDPSDIVRTKKSFYLFDDVILSCQNPIEKFFCRGRHNGVDCIYITQNFFKLPRQTIRENSNIFFIFPQDYRSLTCIYYDLCSSDISLDSFRRFCKFVWQKPFNFVTIDLTKDVNLGRFRRNLSDYWSPLLDAFQ